MHLPSNVTIKHIDTTDIDAIAQIEQAGADFPWPYQTIAHYVDVGLPGVILHIKHHTIAYALFMQETEECHVLNLCVAPGYRAQGWGRYLLLYIIDCAQAEGAETIYLEVRVNNRWARRLYEQCGFCPVGVRKNYYPDHGGHEDAIVLKKTLI